MLTITEAKAVVEGKVVECEIQIDEGKIIGIKKIIAGEKGNVICAKNMLVLPGLIDVHAHILDPVIPESNFKNASEMALTGGITTVLEMPTCMGVLSREEVYKKIEVAKREAIFDYGFHAGNFVRKAEEILSMKGIVKAIKGFLCSPYEIESLEDFFATASNANMLPMLHCEDEETLRKAKKDITKPEEYADLRPPIAERLAVERALKKAIEMDSLLHIVHVSSKESVFVLKRMKNEKHSAEVCPHHLIFAKKDMARRGSLLKMNPPLREREDNAVLWQALISGIIDFVATDHFFASLSEKEKPIMEAPAGIPGLEVLCPLIYTYGVKKHGMSLARFVEVTARAQAKRFGLQTKGEIAEGKDGDLVIINPKAVRKFKSAFWSPYEGMELTGYPEIVMLHGNVVFEHGEIVAKPGSGKFVFSEEARKDKNLPCQKD